MSSAARSPHRRPGRTPPPPAPPFDLLDDSPTDPNAEPQTMRPTSRTSARCDAGRCRLRLASRRSRSGGASLSAEAWADGRGSPSTWRTTRVAAHFGSGRCDSASPPLTPRLTSPRRRARVARMAGSASADWGARDRRVWHQMTGRPPEGAKGPIILAEGDGAWVTDVDGNRYLDGLSGQWCVNVGYGRERLADAAAEQLKRLAFHPLTRGHLPAIELSERLEALLGGERATFYSNSGSEANELAFKLVRQYHQLRGEPGRFKIIARYRAYHGSTLGAMSATGQALRRYGYQPLAPGFLHVQPPDPFRDGVADDEVEAYGRRCADALERVIELE